MADVTALRDALAARINTAIPALRAAETIIGQVSPPVAVILPGNPVITYQETMDGSSTVNLRVLLLVSQADDRTAQLQLDSYLASAGPSSIKAAIEADETLGDTCDYAVAKQVTQYGIIAYGGQDYMGAHMTVEIGAR